MTLIAPSSSALAARRDAQPLPFLKTSFDDTLLEIHSPRHAPPLTSKSITDLRTPSRRPSIQSSSNGVEAQAPVTAKQSRSPILNILHKSKIERSGIKSKSSKEHDVPPRRTPNFSRPGTSDGPSSTQSRPPLPHQKSSEISKTRTSESLVPVIPKVPKRGPEIGFADALRDLEPPKRPRDAPHSPLSSGWVPPPLFQAYPQAVIHSSLEDPNHHTLMINRAKRRVQNLSKEDLTAYARRRSTSSRRKPSISSVKEPDNERKVYVLATAGYILQYTGSGTADRHPEKTLKLGPKSAAFASDAIPGKHWVIQVLQDAAHADVNPFGGQKSFFGRLRGGLKKKTSRSMLLVLDSPSEMNKWMQSIRKEIYKFGEKTPRPRTPSKRPPSVESRKPSVPHRLFGIHRAASPSNLSKAPSPTKPIPSGPSMPTSPTFLESGWTSSGTTLTGNTPVASNRSSRQRKRGKSASESQKAFHLPLYSRKTSRDTQQTSGTEDRLSGDESYSLQQPPNTAVPPLTPTIGVNIGLAESPDNKHPSPDQKQSASGSVIDSPEQQFYTPATTPMQGMFPRNANPETRRNMSPKSPQSSTFSRGVGSDISLVEANQSSTRLPTPASSIAETSSMSCLQQSNSTPALKSFDSGASEPPHSTYYRHQAQEDSFDGSDKSSIRGPVGNAFAQAAALKASDSNDSSIRPTTLHAPTMPIPKRKSSLQPLKLYSTTDEPGHEKQDRRTCIQSKSPLPLQTAVSTAPSSSRSSLKPVREAAMAELGLGIQHVSRSRPTDRDSALSQLIGESDVKPDSDTTQLRPTVGIYPNTNVSNPADRSLPRPPSISVNTNVASFLPPPRPKSGHLGAISAPASAAKRASKTSNPTSATSTPLSGLPIPQSSVSVPTPVVGYPTSSSTPASARSSMLPRNRQSVAVPVVRPPNIRHSSKASRQALRLGSPPTKPPEAPLPAPPTNAPTNTSNASVNAIGVAG